MALEVFSFGAFMQICVIFPLKICLTTLFLSIRLVGIYDEGSCICAWALSISRLIQPHQARFPFGLSLVRCHETVDSLLFLYVRLYKIVLLEIPVRA